MTYLQATIKRYEALGEYLNEAEYEGAENGVIIYPQGSFELGTVIKPIKDTEDAGYDIDLVCETTIPKISTSPEQPEYIKNAIGNKIKESPRYNRMLSKEGKRCWKLQYDEDNGLDFHMDVLPSTRETVEEINQLMTQTDYPELVDTSIAITNKEDMGTYRWSTSNPRGLSNWFRKMNNSSFLTIASKAKQELYENNQKIFASVNDVPDQLTRTPLQRAIQILKRHRDVRFSGHEYEDCKPTSMIITTLSTHCYEDEDNLYDALKNIVSKLTRHSPLIEGSQIRSIKQLIKRNQDDTWYIGNPVNAKENFADRWHEDNHKRANAFFEWVEMVYKDLENDQIFDIGLNKLDELNMLGAAAAITERSEPHIERIKMTKPWGLGLMKK